MGVFFGVRGNVKNHENNSSRKSWECAQKDFLTVKIKT